MKSNIEDHSEGENPFLQILKGALEGDAQAQRERDNEALRKSRECYPIPAPAEVINQLFFVARLLYTPLGEVTGDKGDKHESRSAVAVSELERRDNKASVFLVFSSIVDEKKRGTWSNQKCGCPAVPPPQFVSPLKLTAKITR